MGSRGGIIVRSKPDASGSHNATAGVTLGPAFHHRGARFDRAGAQLGASDVHQDSARATGLFPSFLEIADLFNRKSEFWGVQKREKFSKLHAGKRCGRVRACEWFPMDAETSTAHEPNPTALPKINLS